MNMENLKNIPCGKCGSMYFMRLTRLKYVSPLQSKSGKEEIINMEGLVCIDCGCSDAESFKIFEQKQKRRV